MSERPFDIVLFGATGFTGKLVAEYLAKEAKGRDVKWAIAGRNPVKLEAIRRDLARSDTTLLDLPLRTAESHDVASLDELVPQAKVVCTTVGPYSKYGIELVRACARHGTSYCDLTGEPPFVRRSADECNEEATKNKARIVHCAGYDSIPSDLGTLLARDHAGEDLAWAKVFVGKVKGAISGGTIASMLGIMELAKSDREVRKLLFDPHGLDPVRGDADRDPFEDDQRSVRFDKDIGRWTAPFVMATINTRVVRRSHAILKAENDKGYGPSFRYNEAMSFAKGPAGLLSATAVVAAVGAFMAATAIGPARAALERTVLPAPGEGPSRASIESGFFEMHVLARTESGRMIRGRVAGDKDPGYGGTAIMLAESAMCLAKDEASLPQRWGILTPATGMGMQLVKRLRAAGMTLEAHDA
ncbi:MAG: saccharopine dehydrogenase NADP-binding domain-containing protein [Labilithrix sp.]|nr:saccharopine dehydrogenase NADP-binding domain-containing protein [Labilithrix sp.]MCW5815407.1 saccharopine dehydrogenase NADP-binding domain-containing protein [Labilithrix sp.]